MHVEVNQGFILRGVAPTVPHLDPIWRGESEKRWSGCDCVFKRAKKGDSGLLSCLAHSSLGGQRSRVTAEVNRVNVYVGIYVNSLKKLQAIESSCVSKRQHRFPPEALRLRATDWTCCMFGWKLSSDTQSLWRKENMMRTNLHWPPGLRNEASVEVPNTVVPWTITRGSKCVSVNVKAHILPQKLTCLQPGLKRMQVSMANLSLCDIGAQSSV